MKRGTANFHADEDPSDLFDEALGIAELEDDAALADATGEDFELDVKLLSVARRHARHARRPASG